jgi:hypothetical protein
MIESAVIPATMNGKSLLAAFYSSSVLGLMPPNAKV